MSHQLIYTRGLPGSSKSTWAKQFVLDNPNWKRINMDELRLMFSASDRLSKDAEKFMKKMRDMLIIEALKDGKNVISDNTHLSPKSIEHIKQLVSKFNKDNNSNVKVTEKSFLDVPLEECIRRDLIRPNSVGERVIKKMHRDFIAKETEFTPLVQDKNLPKILLVDIDGTVASHIGIRSPFDWKRVGEDLPKENVIAIIKVLSDKYKIVFFSGRDSVCRNETIEWIDKHFGWTYAFMGDYLLFMREQNDNRKDSIVKEEMFNKYIRDKYFVEGVFDDRLQVCRVWHKLGVQLFRVGDPDSDF